MIEVTEILGIQGTYLNIIKTIYSKSIVNTNLSREKLKSIPLKLGTRQICPLSLYLINIVLDILTRTNKIPEENLGYKN